MTKSKSVEQHSARTIIRVNCASRRIAFEIVRTGGQREYDQEKR
jgi:hypothetical protein